MFLIDPPAGLDEKKLKRWSKLDKDFEKYLRKKPKVADLSSFLSKVYKFDAALANEMWKWLGLQKNKNQIVHDRFYIASTFRHLIDYLPSLDAVEFLYMHPGRVDSVVLLGSPSITSRGILWTILSYLLSKKDIDEFFRVFSLALDRFGGIGAGNRYAKDVFESGFGTISSRYKEKEIDEGTFNEALKKLLELNDPVVESRIEIASIALWNRKVCAEKKEIGNLIHQAIRFEFPDEFLELLWKTRYEFSDEFLLNKWKEYVARHPEKLPLLDYSEEKAEWYGKIISQSEDLLLKYFSHYGTSNYYDRLFLYGIFEYWMNIDDYDKFIHYFPFMQTSDNLEDNISSDCLGTIICNRIIQYITEQIPDIHAIAWRKNERKKEKYSKIFDNVRTNLQRMRAVPYKNELFEKYFGEIQDWFEDYLETEIFFEW